MTGIPGKISRFWVIFLLLGLTCGLAQAKGQPDPAGQTAALMYNEAQTVYLGNLARRQNGVPPLRWNLQLTEAARWFSWDSTENRPAGFCDHQDSQGKWPSDRVVAFGYRGAGGAENAFCGYVLPEAAITGWMNSPGHHDNLLDPNSREVGLGYYQRASDGRGYVTQDFGHDPVYPPVVIENEAPAINTNQANLYIYNAEAGGGFRGRTASVAMQVSNDVCFSGAVWETYAPEKVWQLAPGPDGWRTVYVRTRDALNRSNTVSDSIYRGPSVPQNELGPAQLATRQTQVTLYGLASGGLPQMQFSQGWLADDTFDTFTKWWGNGERVTDPAAWGGTAYRMFSGAGETFAWVWDTTFTKDVPFVAYFRLKVSDNTAATEVARISVKGGNLEYGPLALKGTDFLAANGYQEFPIPFTFNSSSNPDDAFLTFQLWRSGAADVTVDAVSIFTAPQAFTTPVTWSPPDANARGRGIWVRYTDGGGHFSTFSEALTTQPSLNAIPGELSFLVARNGSAPPPRPLVISSHCAALQWQVNDPSGRLQTRVEGNILWVSVNPAGLPVGKTVVNLSLTALNDPGAPPLVIPITLWGEVQVQQIYLPTLLR